MKKVFFLLTLAILSFYNFSKADLDWDLPAYMACVIKKDKNISPIDLHTEVYTTLKSNLSEQQYLHVIGKTDGNKYRIFMSQNPDAFYQQLRYYDIKEFYVDAIFVINLITKDVIFSIYLLNTFCFIIFGFLLFTILFKYCNIGLNTSYIVTILVCLLPTISNLASIASPDLMVLTLLFWLCFSFIRKDKMSLQILITILIVLTRPDYIVFTGLFLLLNLFFHKKENFKGLIFGIFLNFILYFSLLKIYDYPGWESLFYDSFIQRRLDITTKMAKVNFNDYLDVLKTNILNFKKIGLISFSLLIFAIYRFKKNQLVIENYWMIILMFVSLYVKFLFFPSAGTARFFIVFILLMGVFLLNPRNRNNLII